MKKYSITTVLLATIVPFIAFGGKSTGAAITAPAPSYVEAPITLDAEPGMVVFVTLSVNAEGEVEKVQAISLGDTPLFTSSVMNTVKRWSFKPAMKDGVAVKSRVMVPFRVVAEAELYAMLNEENLDFVL
jgi:protein TonB